MCIRDRSTTAGIRAPGNEAKLLARLDQLKAAGATIINMIEPLPYAYEIQNACGWGEALNTPYEYSSYRYLDVDLYNGYTEWPQQMSWLDGVPGGRPMESLFQFNRDFEPQFHNYNTTKIPFDARWPGYSCSIESLDHLVCEAELAK